MEVERRFSLAKRKCGMGLVTAKLRETAAHVIAMSVLVLNLRKIQHALLRMLAYLLEILAQNKNWALVQWTLDSASHPAHKPNIPAININLQIHISSDASPEQIDKIFESMSKHIYKDR